MSLEPTIPVLTVLYLGCSLLIIGMAFLIWSRRPAPGSLSLTIFLLISAYWIICSGMEAAGKDPAAQDLWAKMTYAGILAGGVGWLCFTLNYYGARWIRKPLHIILLCLIPAFVLVFTLTYQFSSTIWEEIAVNYDRLQEPGNFLPEMVYLVSSFYQYGLYLAGAVVLVVMYRRKPRFFRKQIILMLIGTAIPVAGTLIELVAILPFTKLDITPFYLLFGSVLYSVAFIRFRFMDILPVAYKTLIREIPDGIIVIDQEGYIQEVNPSAGAILNQKREAVITHPLAEIWPQLGHLANRSLESGHNEIITGDSDQPKHLDVGSVVLYDQDNKPVGKLVVMRDISEIKSVQRSLEDLFKREYELRRDLEEEMQKRTQYSRAVVHELRNPLTSIIACTELLEDQVKEQIQKSLVQNIHRSSINLEQRVNELFELARGEVGLIKIDPAPLDMARLINDIVAEMGPVADSRGVVLRAALSAPELPITADRSRMRQILTNLVGNSLKFTPGGEIVIRAGLEKGYLTVQVADTGKGIDSEQMQFLFDPYRRKSKEGQNTSGLGIGLALCKIFVELHHGRIWAESQVGQGTTISFRLPRKQTAGSPDQSARAAAVRLPGGSSDEPV